MAQPQNRALYTAVLLSLAAHALILFGQLPAVRRALDPRPPPEPIVARLAEPESPEPAKAEPEKRPEPKRVVPPKPAAEPERKPAPVAESPLREPAPAAPRAEEPPPVAAPQAAAPPPAASTPSTSAQARVAATEAAVAQAIAQYRERIKDAAGPFHRYPPLARENNWEGPVDVRMRIRGDGTLAALDVKQGSGHEVLDEQALDMFRRAQERVPLPSALRGRDIMLELRVVYRLKDIQ